MTDYLVRNRKSVLTVLRLTVRADGWASHDVAQLGVLSTLESDVDVARPAFDALMATGNVPSLTEVFDAMARRLPDPAGAPDERGGRAVRAFTRAAHEAPDRASLYSPQRLNWLLERLLRARRGIYLRPGESRFGIRAPSVEKVVEEIKVRSGKTIVSSGAAAANHLGLTTQYLSVKFI
ncbi:hypothetical protein I6F09_25225 [Bradyrhizobium sp. IC3195]|nr:hypothetical protein [Bradyrhizobium sp. IC3195]